MALMGALATCLDPIWMRSPLLESLVDALPTCLDPMLVQSCSHLKAALAQAAQRDGVDASWRGLIRPDDCWGVRVSAFQAALSNVETGPWQPPAPIRVPGGCNLIHPAPSLLHESAQPASAHIVSITVRLASQLRPMYLHLHYCLAQ